MKEVFQRENLTCENRSRDINTVINSHSLPDPNGVLCLRDGLADRVGSVILPSIGVNISSAARAAAAC